MSAAKVVHEGDDLPRGLYLGGGCPATTTRHVGGYGPWGYQCMGAAGHVGAHYAAADTDSGREYIAAAWGDDEAARDFRDTAERVARDRADFERDRARFFDGPTTDPTTTGSTAGGAGMSRILEGQQFLLNAAREFDDLAPNVAAHGEPEEIGQLLQAGQLEDEAEQLLAQASGATTAQQAADLARQAEQLFMQAEGLRQQVEQGLMGRAGNAAMNAEAAAGARNQIMEAAAGTATGDELVAQASAIHAAIDESGTRLAGAASMATARDQTEPCLGLIKEAQEQCATAAGMCGQLSRDLTEYAGRL